MSFFSSLGSLLVIPFWSFRVTFGNKNGSKTWSVYATPNHRWLITTREGKYKEVYTKNLKIGNNVSLHCNESIQFGDCESSSLGKAEYNRLREKYFSRR